MTVSTIKMTAQQYLQLGEDPPGVRLELVNGEVAVSPSPVPDHAYAIIELAILLGQHVKRNGLGRVYSDLDIVLGPHDVRCPDMIFVARARLNIVGKKAVQGPPDLCIEVISPGSASVDRTDRFDEYQAFGVACYWIIDPAERTIEAYKLAEGRYVRCGRGQSSDIVRLPPFPDLEIPLAELWQPE